VLCGAALRNKGIQPLLNTIVEVLPSPIDVPPIVGHIPDSGKEASRPADEKGPFSALAFKVQMDQGRKMTYIRVYSGSAKVGEAMYNPGKKVKEKLARLLKMHSNKRERVDRASAGDILAVMGLKLTSTGDTLCHENHPILLEPMQFDAPVISMAVEPKRVQDQDKLFDALEKLSDEDPTFKSKVDEETGQTVISGMGELHLDILMGRLKREFFVDTNHGKPQVVYRETISKKAQHQEIFQRELAGQQHFAGVTIEVAPLSRGTGNRFYDRCENPGLSEEFLNAIREGIEEASGGGVLMGYPAIDVETALLDVQIHDMYSDALAFRVAASRAFETACSQADPILLEPIMKAEILIPEEFMGEVIGDLNSRQGKIEQIAAKGPIQVLTASVPLSKMFGYSTALRSLSQGRGIFTMHFSHYDKA
jgi:elongation factor G